MEARSHRFARFNTEDYPLKSTIVWRDKGDCYLQIGARDICLNDVSAVWYRRPVSPVVDGDLSPLRAQWAQGEAREALMGVWRNLDALWVNHPDRNRVAESKMLQLRVASELGFDTPDSVVTNSGDEEAKFLEMHSAGAICKPLFDGRVPVDEQEQLFFTSTVESGSVSIADLGSEPYLFQNRIAKSYDVRATVIGDEVFAVRIASQDTADTTIDWRRGYPSQLAHTPFELPDETAVRCISLCRHFGLAFGAIDLAERPDGGFTFFEINPNGQWVWVEQMTGLPLRSRMVNLFESAE